MSLKNVAFLFVKLPAALLLGCAVAVGILQNDPRLKGALERRIVSSMATIIGESFDLSVDEIDLFHGEIVMHNLSSSSPDKTWSFTCPVVRLQVSWLSWFKGANAFDASVTFENPVLFTKYAQGSLAIAKPFFALMNAPITVPLNFVQYRTQGSVGTIASESGELMVHGATITSIEPRNVVTHLLAHNGSVRHGSRLLAEHLQGRLTIEAPSEAPYSCTLKCTGMRPSSKGDMGYNLYGTYAQGVGVCHCRSEDGSLSFEGRTKAIDEGMAGDVTLQGSLGELVSCIIDDARAYEAAGTVRFVGTISAVPTGYAYSGNAELADAQYRGVTLSSAHVKLEGDEREVKATISDAESSGIGLKGSLIGRFASKEVSGSLSFSHPYEGIPRCTFEKGRSTIYYKDGILKSEFKADSTLFDTSKLPLRGSVTTDFKHTKVVGTAGGNPVHLEFELNPFTVKKFTVSDTLHQKRIALHQDGSDAQALKGMIDGLVLKKLIQALTGYQLSGSIEAQVRSSREKEVQRIEFLVKDGSLKIPGTYTVIKEISGLLEIDMARRCVKIHDLMIAMHKGFAWSSCATFYLNESGELSSAHVPLQCKDLLISKQKELFGTISGGITAFYAEGAWRCSGILMIENAHLRSNLLSSQVQKDLMQATAFSKEGRDIDIDLRVQSRNPLKVQTSFLKADAHIDMKITGKATSPEMEGVIELAHGSFDFPYKPLFVTQGKLILAPHQPEGPVINLTAKNKIRAYTVTMSVTGTLEQPQVRFEASPQLSEEGIITLLLAGSDHGSLSAAMPRVLMQQIGDVIFGSEEKLSAAQQFLKNLLTPLKNVRLVKKGATQDDLQAVLEVDINDRLRAKAQNDLTLSGDTQLELEYTVSDDVTVKAVRDQEGSLGGEVEMRWKF